MTGGQFNRNRIRGLILGVARRRWAVVAMAAQALLCVACSTPEGMPIQKQEDSSWAAYQECLESLPRTAHPSLCDSVGSGSAYSYNQYTGYGYGYGYGYDNSSGGGRLRGAVAPGAANSKLQDQAYREYLAALSASQRESLRIQWQTLSERVAR